jgi:hypothetical protein
MSAHTQLTPWSTRVTHHFPGRAFKQCLNVLIAFLFKNREKYNIKGCTTHVIISLMSRDYEALTPQLIVFASIHSTQGQLFLLQRHAGRSKPHRSVLSLIFINSPTNMALSPEQTPHGYQSDIEQPLFYEMSRLKPVIQPFAGRMGGNQEIVLDRSDPQNADLLKKFPDAAPLMSFREGTDLRGFWDLDLWKFGFIEMIGK